MESPPLYAACDLTSALVATFENIGAEPLYLHQNQYQRLHLRLTRQRVQCHSQILERALKSRSAVSKSVGTVRTLTF